MNPRLNDIKALVEFWVPIELAVERLTKYPFDYSGRPFALSADHVRSALRKFKNRAISEAELVCWANALEMRDDVKPTGISAEETKLIFDSLFVLANPELSVRPLEVIVDELICKLGTFGNDV